eukprot:CAMPEP_0179021928 /NCGR_PEP_ID=MMETSP0796-20121207/6144_1 /TAXON_ID=73915 /ORGANISM="Pyrodinium bahamense, Strain pbaha01" /LENGTH=448 /DNA_ID=CAMNT_0020717777 /DNA_START=111 /DNA_END=1457 /DNA_ORIENTATION=+
MTLRVGGCSEKAPLLCSGSASISNCQIAVLVFAIFIKGGLLGAYVPFSSLWLSLKGYRARDLGTVALVDACCTFFLPIIGGCVDKLRAHNTSFVLILALLGALKLAYLPAASSFVAILILTAVTAPLLRASNSMLDALALYAFPKRATFSRARLAGDLGFGFIALSVGFAIDAAGTEDVMYLFFACMCGTLSCVWCVAMPYMSSIRPDSTQMSAAEFRQNLVQLGTTFGSWATLRAMFILYLIGCGIGLIVTFELVLLKDMMGSGSLLGLCKAVGSMAAIPVWWYVIQLMDLIGFKNVQLIGVACFGVRCCILGAITDPRHALLSELLGGAGGFPLAYASITVFTGRVVAEDMKGTAQTLVIVVFMALGAGVSPLLGSAIAEKWGIQPMFTCFGALLMVVCILCLIYDLVDRFIWGTYRSLEESCGWAVQPDEEQLTDDPSRCSARLS